VGGLPCFVVSLHQIIYFFSSYDSSHVLFLGFLLLVVGYGVVLVNAVYFQSLVFF
jgi:hypothetical protein